MAFDDRAGLNLLRFRPERAESFDLAQQLGSVFTGGGEKFSLQLPHLFLAVVATIQFNATFDHVPRSPKMSESAQYHVCLAYGPEQPVTSDDDGRIRQILIAVWVVMVLQGLVFVYRYALINPYVDEWEFVGALYGEEPPLPWLWKLHNEHRFPLPRVLYWALFWLTGDLRTGCYVSLAGMSALAYGLMVMSRKIRGKAALADGVFPLLLLHSAQDENLYMGYQICFMLTVVLAIAQFAGMLFTNPENQFRRGWQVGLLGTASLMCGAAGLAYGSVALAWVGWMGLTGKMSKIRKLILLGFAFVTPIYLIFYRMGYRRPAHHPPSAGVYESIRIGLEAQAMSIGPVATRMWPMIGIVLFASGIGVFLLILSNLRKEPQHRPRWLGLLALLAGSAGVAFGIGWGRSGFVNEMGFAWRYGWITLPALITLWFACLLSRDKRLSQKFLNLLAILTLVSAPINCVTGFRDAERGIKTVEQKWEAWVRDGLGPREITLLAFPDVSESFREEMIGAMELMRKNRYNYYVLLREDDAP